MSLLYRLYRPAKKIGGAENPAPPSKIARRAA
jgi:hypothetical protein